MEEAFSHAVFVEVPARLAAAQRRKIENHFKIQRKSGGGECGSLTDVGDKVYSIAFKEAKVQQRVLQQRSHVVEFPEGNLELIVRAGPEPPASPPTHDSNDLNQAASSQQHTPASNTPSSGASCELELDQYLVRHLKETPTVEKQLQEELASLGCRAQLNPDEGTVLVRRSSQSAADRGGGEGWEQDARAVFQRLKDRYCCHYEMEPSKVKALLRSSSQPQAEDQLKVYSEAGVAIVVGEQSEVRARLSSLGDPQAKDQDSVPNMTQTRRLRPSKHCLLWREIEQGMQEFFPAVKVVQRDAGQIHLEGSADEILRAGRWISAKESSVLEKAVKHMSKQFFGFIMKAYADVKKLSDFLKVGNEVEMETRETELRIFSLSAERLDEAERALRVNFKDENINLPYCFAVPPKLQQKLRAMVADLNDDSYKVRATFGSDNTVSLVGHAKEVDDLTKVVTDFILDQASIEAQVLLPSLQILDVFEKVLQLHEFDHSGVIFHPLTSSPQPMVVLEGPSHKVTEVRNRLGPLLDSLVEQTLTIDLPGAVRYFQSSPGRETLSTLSESQKCMLQLQGQDRSSAGHSSSGYTLGGGLRVQVCEGDITKVQADALVNAANEDLDHCGGVAAALSKAAGPEMQKESRDIVKNRGKVRTGEAVATTGGKLKCKALLHAVGPDGNTAGDQSALLKRTVHAALDLAEMMLLQSIAIPCISSGIFGVPIRVCSEAIVNAIKEFGSQPGRSLQKIMLIDNRDEVVRAIRQACDRILGGASAGSSWAGDSQFPVDAAAGDAAGGARAEAPGNSVLVETVQGTIETQQVEALVSPMNGHDPLSSRVSHALVNMVGSSLTHRFHQEARGATAPGDAVFVGGLTGLQCNGVFFLNLAPWDNRKDGNAVKTLRKGIRVVLNSCERSGFSSVAFPALGTGSILQIPHGVAAKILLREIREFEQQRSSRRPLLVRIVIHPSDRESTKAYTSAQKSSHPQSFTNAASADKAPFFRHVSSAQDEITAQLGNVKLQMVKGNIVRETTDVIVNTTDFSSMPTGVSKAILTAAGQGVQQELAQKGRSSSGMCSTRPGALGCKEIVHCTFMAQSDIISKSCKSILSLCESQGYSSAAFPAINTGAAGLDFTEACKAMLEGMASAISEMKPTSLCLIRIVILQPQIFKAFRSYLESQGGLGDKSPLSKLKETKLFKWFSKNPASPDLQALSFKPQPAQIRVITCNGDTIRKIKADLEKALQDQLIEREVKVQDFLRLDASTQEAMLAKVSCLGIALKHSKRPAQDASRESRHGAEASGSGEGSYTLGGLKEDVLSITELVSSAIQKLLSRDIQEKNEQVLALRVHWLMVDDNEVWQELRLRDNYILEDAHQNKRVMVEITAPNDKIVDVNLTKKEATDRTTGKTYRVTRKEIESNLELPSKWEPMGDETFKRVEVKQSTQEYKDVATAFLNTAKYNIQKIERVQNLFLWQAYTVCRRRILKKNGRQELGEKTLYHGASAEACKCIERDRFDRAFAGQHAAVYGKGVYFAVNARLSAGGYARPDASGLKRLYVARVLTGRYTTGHSGLAKPPARGSDPTDLYDSVVDGLPHPTMFVIFHDDQAYPEYLITFK